MNWFTNTYSTTVKEEYDRCEHLEVGSEAYRVSKEVDSFGTVGAYAMCKDCSDTAEKEVGEIEEYCHDCNTLKPMKEITEWKWYDFYAAQGDEPLLICDSCRVKEKHKNRVAKDRKDYEDEMDYYDNN